MTQVMLGVEYGNGNTPITTAIKHATCNMQHATCNFLHVAWNLQQKLLQLQ